MALRRYSFIDNEGKYTYQTHAKNINVAKSNFKKFYLEQFGREFEKKFTTEISDYYVTSPIFVRILNHNKEEY